MEQYELERAMRRKAILEREEKERQVQIAAQEMEQVSTAQLKDLD